MAKKITAKDAAGSLSIALNAPGMTPILKAGIGGLAASLRAINKKSKQKWQCGMKVILKNGWAIVEETKIIIEWPEGFLEDTLKYLWNESFQLSNDVIYLPGSHLYKFDGCNLQPIRFQSGLKATFLQHGKTTTAKGDSKRLQLTVNIDDRDMNLTFQPYQSYAHQSIIGDVIKSIKNKTYIKLPGWAYPGAAQRHVAHNNTKAEYSPEMAIAAIFSIVGCISLPNEIDNGGFLIVPEPDNLIEYARKLAILMPIDHTSIVPASLGDAILLANFYHLINSLDSPFISNISGVIMKSVAWDTKQKYRTSLINFNTKCDNLTNMEYYTIMRTYLPPIFIPTKNKDGENTWMRPSYLRAFAADNLVRGKPWYEKFSTHSVIDGKKTCYLHTYRTKDSVGLLNLSEKEALIKMTDKLPDPERLLIATMHQAIKRQLGSVNEDYEKRGGDRKKRFRDEMQRIRISFAHAKTQTQVLSAFADLWSKAGRLKPLQDDWEKITEFLVNKNKWEWARDLALIGLASYKGKDWQEDEHEDGQ
jgi:CRISPR-associated protein Cas8a1/Csx13